MLEIDKLNNIIDARINEMFSSNKFYDDIRSEATSKYDTFLKKHGKEAKFTESVIFDDENVLKNAISIAMKETVKLLAENGYLQVPD